jgi:uncharacterized membrane protein
MEIVNKKEIKAFVKLLLSLTIILTAIPIIAYFINFSGSISEKQSDWGAFGDFFGGIVGTIFSLIAVIFSFISIYITLKIATKIYEEEEKLHKKNDLRETKKLEREIELVHRQNKPLPHIFENYTKDKIRIYIENHGIGSLKIVSWKIKYKGKEFSDFENLLNHLHHQVDMEWDDSSQITLSPGKRKNLIRIMATTHDIDAVKYLNYRKKCKDIFEEVELFFECEDIFENKFTYRHKLGNLVV